MGVVFVYASIIVWGFIVPCTVVFLLITIAKATAGSALSSASENDRLFYSPEGRKRNAEINAEAEKCRQKIADIEARRSWTDEDWEAFRLREESDAAAKTEEIRKIAQMIAEAKETSLYL